MGDASLAGYQRKKVWINDGAGRFTDVAQVVGATDRYDGRAVALADLSNRGVLDVIVANQRGPLLLYRNKVAPGRALDRLRAEGAAGGRGRQRVQQPQRDRRAGQRVLERAAAGAGGVAADRASARRTSGACTSASGRDATVDKRRHPLAVGQDAGADAAGGQPRPQGRGAGMTIEAAPRRRRRRARLDGCGSIDALPRAGPHHPAS